MSEGSSSGGDPHPKRAIWGPLAGLPLLEDLPPVDGARVLLRVDFNVPLGPVDDDGLATVEDDFRIKAAMPTISWLLERGAHVTACTHLGRPKGVVDPAFSVEPLRRILATLAPTVELEENLRFNPGEETNDPQFVNRLVSGFDAYVNDAFGASHRAHASVVGPPSRLPSAAGRLLEREVEVLGQLLVEPAKPFVAIVGGAKLSDKLGVLRTLLDRVDLLVVGGAMAFTFLRALGHRTGSSLMDVGKLEECKELLHKAGDRMVLPVDVVALAPDGEIGCGSPGRGEVQLLGMDVPIGWKGLDIGPKTEEVFAAAIRGAGTVLWNGPMGAFEDPRFMSGTTAVAQAVAACPGMTVVGGGDSVAALEELKLTSKVSFVSTGGGATLELIEHGDLPGLEALRSAPNAPRVADPS
ncbi:MAG: phosphoglycerate kinase [Acidimicrobiales bacterium]